jgi:hypothetical protein
MANSFTIDAAIALALVVLRLLKRPLISLLSHLLYAAAQKVEDTAVQEYLEKHYGKKKKHKQ